MTNPFRLLLLLSPLLMLGLFAPFSTADIYMHSPAGSNNRNRERRENRRNDNRLFDSQNNAKGGYAWQGDREASSAALTSSSNANASAMEYYVGSTLQLEWTAQHGCGSDPTTGCQVVVQYACEDTMPGLRDGYPSGGLTNADDNNAGYQTRAFQRNTGGNGANGGEGTDTISEATATDVEYGMHENFAYYEACQNRQRNKGLFTADQNLNGNDATKTRQNPNGNRSGFECPEERDYYPYWAPTPWRDAAVLTSHEDQCTFYQEHSRNVMGIGFCQIGDAERQSNAPDGKAPLAQQPCEAAGGVWATAPAWGTDAPFCGQAARSRQNYLGDVVQTVTSAAGEGTGAGAGESGILASGAGPARFDWNVPGDVLDATGADSALCVLRMRYNVSTTDYAAFGGMALRGSLATALPLDASDNCDQGDGADSGCGDGAADLADGARPRYNRPYVQAFAPGVDPELGIALNTNQAGRTFQDRSYVFRISKRPSQVPADAAIVNVNVRGKRGNIVQVFPAVEYDFVPSEAHVAEGAFLHFQWTGSDFNPPRNPNNGEGWRFSDRSNLVQVAEPGSNFPLARTDAAAGGSASALFERDAEGAGGEFFFGNVEQARRFALLEQAAALAAQGGGAASCGVFEDGTSNEQNSPTNCGKLNAAPAHFNGGLVEATSRMAGKTFSFVSTRNNNFSNRAQKWQVQVHGRLSTWEIALIVLGALLGAALLAYAVVVAVRYRRTGRVELGCTSARGFFRGAKTAASSAVDMTGKGGSAKSAKSKSSNNSTGGKKKSKSKSKKKKKKTGDVGQTQQTDKRDDDTTLLSLDDAV